LESSIAFKDLIAEDYRDFVAAFYFPNQAKIITDDRISIFMKKTNYELLKVGQKPDVINLIVKQALLFLE